MLRGRAGYCYFGTRRKTTRVWGKILAIVVSYLKIAPRIPVVLLPTPSSAAAVVEAIPVGAAHALLDRCLRLMTIFFPVAGRASVAGS